MRKTRLLILFTVAFAIAALLISTRVKAQGWEIQRWDLQAAVPNGFPRPAADATVGDWPYHAEYEIESGVWVEGYAYIWNFVFSGKTGTNSTTILVPACVDILAYIPSGHVYPPGEGDSRGFGEGSDLFQAFQVSLQPSAGADNLFWFLAGLRYKDFQSTTAFASMSRQDLFLPADAPCCPPPPTGAINTTWESNVGSLRCVCDRNGEDCYCYDSDDNLIIGDPVENLVCYYRDAEGIIDPETEFNVEFMSEGCEILSGHSPACCYQRVVNGRLRKIGTCCD